MTSEKGRDSRCNNLRRSRCQDHCHGAGADNREAFHQAVTEEARQRLLEPGGLQPEQAACIEHLPHLTERRIMSKRSCPVCGRALGEHPVCDACEALIGPHHAAKSLFPYRGRELCLYCLCRWERMEMVTGREITWEHFCHPPTVLAGNKQTEVEQSETETGSQLNFDNESKNIEHSGVTIWPKEMRDCTIQKIELPLWSKDSSARGV